MNTISPTFISLYGDYVYFTSSDVGIGRVLKDGGSVTIYSTFSGANNLALDDTYVYWTGNNQLQRAPQTGGAIETLASFTNDTFGILVDDSYAYVGDTVDTVWRVAKTGGTPHSIGNTVGRPMRMAFDAVGLVIAVWDGYPGLARLYKDGSGPPSWFSQTANAYSVAIDQNIAYWTSQNVATSGVRELPESGSPLTTHALGGIPDGIAIDGVNVYWTDRTGSVQKSAKGSPGTTTLAAGPWTPRAIAVDATCLFYTIDCCAGGGGQIIRRSK